MATQPPDQPNAACDKVSRGNLLTKLDQQIRDAAATSAAARTRQLATTAAEEALDELTSTPARI